MSSSAPERPLSGSFPIVGVGASAGGVDAFASLLSAMPADTGMAFVLIQHLDPSHPSFLGDVLARSTEMPVAQAVDGERVKPNHVYVIPPSADIAILHGRLTLLPRRTDTRPLHLPIDFFFRSLAEDRGNRAIGVVLTGTASDGTEGLKAIKGEDGITFAQDPTSARFDGMPRSAIDAGVVDYILPIPQLVQELVRLSRHPYLAAQVESQRSDDATLIKIFAFVRNAVGVDFSEFKSPTFDRRLARRMALRKVDVLQDYLALLQSEPEEASYLYEDILIHVTSFFRDPEVFESLVAEAFPRILENKQSGDPIRVWVAGCSTGEEVYSLAICLSEFLDDSGKHPIQIFGSDVSEKSIDQARIGCFSDARMKDVSDERRRRYFTKADNGYRINKTIRDMCVFVRHDLARDPPFSKLDLVSCRNVLIYFDQALQRRVLPTFHYALKQGGFLLLGRTESIAGFAKLFSPAGTTRSLFARSGSSSALRFAPRLEVHPAASFSARGPLGLPRRTIDLSKQLDRVLLARYAPPGILINEKLEILKFAGDTGAYLRPASGDPQNNVAKMARASLVVAIRAAVLEAKKLGTAVRANGVDASQTPKGKACDILVMPFLPIPDLKEALYVVLFEHSRTLKKKKKKKKKNETAIELVAEPRDVLNLRNKLAATEEYLQSLIDDQDRTNDDLNSANEELTSGNEELQSMNEELETAKEELQSTNEELVTVNDELHSRNQEASEVNSDLVNLLSTVDVPIAILDASRRIRRFNPKARLVLNFLPTDIGRPLQDIRTTLQIADLDTRIADVIETNTMYESEVQDLSGCWYRMQIRPYKNVDNKIDGAMLSLVDIDALKHHVNEAQSARRDAERANLAKDQFLATLSHEIRTPLSSMLMQAQLLRRGEVDPAKVKRAGEAIERGTKMQAKLIDDLLDVSRIIAGKLGIELKPVQLSTVIHAAIESVAAPAKAKAIVFDLELDEDIGHVSGDAIRLQQAIGNLLGNAVKFSAENSTVTVMLDGVDGRARVRVRDTGSGIEPQFLPFVFNRFAQEDGSTSRVHGGLGLGLAIVRHLVEAHGGNVQAESAGRGKGAVFTILLPVMAKADLTEDMARTASSNGPSKPEDLDATRMRGLLAKLRVLVVDDDLPTRDAVALLLGEAGAKVRVAESAKEALEVVEHFRPQVLLCDIGLPGEDGYSLIRKVRALGADRGGDVPAVAFTAFAGEENRRKAIDAGFQMHLVKPADIATLADALVQLSHRAPPAA